MAKKIGARGTTVVFYSPTNCSIWGRLCALPLTLNARTVRFGGRRHSLQHLDQLSGWAAMHAGLPVLALFCSPIIIVSFFLFRRACISCKGRVIGVRVVFAASKTGRDLVGGVPWPRPRCSVRPILVNFSLDQPSLQFGPAHPLDWWVHSARYPGQFIGDYMKPGLYCQFCCPSSHCGAPP